MRTKNNQFGRSMIEILGVLALVGILSVGGISGYGKAMSEYKINKVTDEYNTFISDILPYKDDFIKTQKRKYPNQLYSLASVLEKSSLIPQGWKRINNYINDSIGNNINPHVSSSSILVINFNISKKYGETSVKFCRNIMLKTIIPYQSYFHYVQLYEGSNKGTWYGSTECRSTRNCLSNMTITDIENLCRTCTGEQPSCVLNLLFE